MDGIPVPTKYYNNLINCTCYVHLPFQISLCHNPFPYCFPILSVFEKLSSHKIYLSKHLCLVQDPSPKCPSLWWWITGTCSSPGHIPVGAPVPDTSAKRKLKILPICKWPQLCTGTDRGYLDIFPLFIFFHFFSTDIFPLFLFFSL